MSGAEDNETDPAGKLFPLQSNRDVMTVLANLLSNQYVFFAGVSKDWRSACGHLPKLTQAITADTSVSQLQWSFDCGLSKGAMVSERIAEHCNIEVLQCAHSNGCVLFAEACYKAAARGDLEMIEWAIERNRGWRLILCRAAAAAGDLRILKWARDIGCSWDPNISGRCSPRYWGNAETRTGCLGGPCTITSAGRRLAIFKLRGVHCFHQPYRTCECAAAGGHLEVLQWASAQGCAFGDACIAAIRNGHLNTLEWLVARGCNRPTMATSVAAVAGHVHILEWMHASKYN